MHVEVGDNHSCVVHLLALVLTLISNLLRHELAAGARLLQAVLAHNLAHVIRLEVIPHTVGCNREKTIARGKLMELDLRFT